MQLLFFYWFLENTFCFGLSLSCFFSQLFLCCPLWQVCRVCARSAGISCTFQTLFHYFFHVGPWAARQIHALQLDWQLTQLGLELALRHFSTCRFPFPFPVGPPFAPRCHAALTIDGFISNCGKRFCWMRLVAFHNWLNTKQSLKSPTLPTFLQYPAPRLAPSVAPGRSLEICKARRKFCCSRIYRMSQKLYGSH